MGSSCLVRTESQFGKMTRVLKLDCGDSGTTIDLCLQPVHLKMVEVANHMLHILYHNKNGEKSSF